MTGMDPNTPAWALAAAAAISALVGAGYLVVRFARYCGKEYLAWRTEKREADRKEEAADREAEGQQWAAIIRRMEAELRAHETRLQTAESSAKDALTQAATCKSDHAGTKRLFRFWFEWGKSQGMKLPKEVEAEIRKLLGPVSSPSGSGSYSPQLQGDET